jgi:hypothetical protein
MDNQELPQTETGSATPAPELTVTDLANLRAIVDVAVRRGVFAAAEVSAVGATFDKLNAFLNAIQPPKTEDAAADAAQ